MDFEWDPEKAEVNLERHGIDFAEAVTVFGDPLEVTISAPDHSEGERRFLSLGKSDAGRLLVVAYAERARECESSARGKRLRASEGHMKQGTHGPDGDMRPEYDFSHGVRGKHHAAYRAGTNLILLDDDVAKAFPDSASVNRALRLLLDLARDQAGKKRSA